MTLEEQKRRHRAMLLLALLVLAWGLNWVIAKMTLELWLLIGFNCLIGNGVAYWLMNLVSRDLPAGMVSMGLLGVPLVLAAGLIIVGIVLGTMSGRRKI